MTYRWKYCCMEYMRFSCLCSSLGLLWCCDIYMSFIHLEFILVYGINWWSSFIFLLVLVQFSQHYLLKRLFLFHFMSLPPLSNTNWPQWHGFISGLSILFHGSMCLFLGQHQTVWITVALYYSLMSDIVTPPTLFFFLKIAEAIWVLFLCSI